MLDKLRRIVQEVSSARDLPSALATIVMQVQDTMQTDVCSVYLFNAETHKYVLMDTRGLNPEAIGRVSLAPSEGLVGYVGQREEPVNLEEAPAHPRYRYLAETGEEKYHSFLGVPIIHQRRVLGVLVVQQQAKRRFDEGEEAFLVTVSAQLAGVLAHALATGAVQDPQDHQGQVLKQASFQGIAGATGIALGEGWVITPPADLNSVSAKQITDIASEQALLLQALASVRADIQRISQTLEQGLGQQERLLFDGYLQMLDDEILGAEICSHIAQGEWAQGALRSVIDAYLYQLERVDDAYLRERAADIRDLGRRILSYLQAQQPPEVCEYPPAILLISEELTPAMLGEVPRERLVGLVSVQGSSNSHIAILARAMGIPTIMGMTNLPYTRLQGRSLVLDGYHGKLITNPTPEVEHHYRQLLKQEQMLADGLAAERDLPCETLDGIQVPLWVNTGLGGDNGQSLAQGAQGVGLYRTEVPFMIQERFPSEQEQARIYRTQLEAFAPQQVTMRTLDIGGDKDLPYFPIEEANPFLGWRGIRVTLDHPEVFLAQIRAMLRASEGLENLRIMLPMIASTHEVDEALSLLQRAKRELRQEGVRFQDPPVGVMIEVPAAVFQVEALAQRVHFLSVGSNDLTQYLLAVDRNNSRVAHLYSAFHPSVLQALQRIVRGAHARQRSVSICGELAGDPAGALLLLAMGYDALSMNAPNLAKVKRALRQVHLAQVQALLADVLTLDTAQQVYAHVERFMHDVGLNPLLRPSAPP
ncbi:phosphotransferase system, enzyme I, PtsP [Allopseudospirillum japonicum]|uniref:phosphoenolpyruvate--protein phosphotransferase n=1 Tax=Allopseudospirillum japonicum TaxID=64971 RepID=A0A1H6QPF5_9GAMM|nr:phosphoenolpyruvate--protein phosphotransferase [Allopseudospirillum japonicum]SEI45453.1 phosphotransferase system, enzyme I, PtsP [Allopseudospirillum japonicum]